MQYNSLSVTTETSKIKYINRDTPTWNKTEGKQGKINKKQDCGYGGGDGWLFFVTFACVINMF